MHGLGVPCQLHLEHLARKPGRRLEPRALGVVRGSLLLSRADAVDLDVMLVDIDRRRDVEDAVCQDD